MKCPKCESAAVEQKVHLVDGFSRCILDHRCGDCRHCWRETYVFDSMEIAAARSETAPPPGEEEDGAEEAMSN